MPLTCPNNPCMKYLQNIFKANCLGWLVQWEDVGTQGHSPENGGFPLSQKKSQEQRLQIGHVK